MLDKRGTAALRRGKKRKDSIYRFSDSYEFKFVEYEYKFDFGYEPKFKDYEYKFEDYAFNFLVDYNDSLDLEPYTYNYEPYFPDYRDYELNHSDPWTYYGSLSNVLEKPNIRGEGKSKIPPARVENIE
jgi:hypothetical protein